MSQVAEKDERESNRRSLKSPVVQDAVFGIVLAIGSLGLLLVVWQSEWGRVATTDPLGVRFVPTMALVAILLGLATYWLEFVRGKITNAADTSWQIRQALLLGICGLIYFSLTFRLGIILGLVLTLPALLWLTGYRDIRKILVITVVFGSLTYLMFGRVLDVFLPQALWL